MNPISEDKGGDDVTLRPEGTAGVARAFISGGLAFKNPYLVDCDTFKAEFTNSATKGKLLADIPIFLIEDSGIGLWGAAIYGILKFQEKIF